MTNATIEIYTWEDCPYCQRAKTLLTQKGASFKEYKIDGDEAARDKMANRANGRRTVPQIFIDGFHIGGCDDLHAMNDEGLLDSLLKLVR